MSPESSCSRWGCGRPHLVSRSSPQVTRAYRTNHHAESGVNGRSSRSLSHQRSHYLAANYLFGQYLGVDLGPVLAIGREAPAAVVPDEPLRGHDQRVEVGLARAGELLAVLPLPVDSTMPSRFGSFDPSTGDPGLPARP